MKIIPLSEYVLENGQAKTAEALGYTKAPSVKPSSVIAG
jgi:hypothetical protein